MFNKGQLAGLMKQAQVMQDKMQQQMAKIDEELAGIEVEGQSGAGMVKVSMTGKSVVKRVAIDPSLLAVALPSLAAARRQQRGCRHRADRARERRLGARHIRDGAGRAELRAGAAILFRRQAAFLHEGYSLRVKD